MRPHIAAICLAALAVLPSACTVGSGEIVSEARAVSGFDEIDLRSTGEVRITVDGTESLEIDAEDNIIDRLTSEVSGSTLILSADGPIQPTETIVYTVTMASLEGFEISGSGSIEVSEFTTEDFSIDVSGSGSAAIADVMADRVVARISGSGAITISGGAGELDLAIGGSGSFTGDRLEVTEANVDISGSGSATVNACEQLDVEVSGSGSVEYLGDPSLTVDTSGSGSVSRR